MNTRPAWGVLTLGALIVIALFFSPIWLKQFSGYIEQSVEVAPFPDEFYLLSRQAQDIYLELYETNPQMAIDLVAARLEEPVDFEEQDPQFLSEVADPTQVVELLTGTFTTIDPIRLSGGTATIKRLPDGRTYVRLEELNAVNGPELHVMLTAYPRPTTREELDEMIEYEIDLGELKGNQGNQVYFITDPTFNIDNYTEGSVILYSARYNLVFSYASLAPPG